MRFYENLQYLRKLHNLTQEQLAEKLDVSRQAVSKWEADASYPEMDKLLMLCELFEMDMDTLVQGDASKAGQRGKQEFDRFQNKCALAITLGVCLILFGVTLLLFFSYYIPPERAVILLMLCITGAVFLFVYFGIQMDHAQKKRDFWIDYYTEEEHDEFARKFSIAMAGGVCLILLGVVAAIALESMGVNEYLLGALFLLFVTIAVGIFVYYGIQKGKYNRCKKAGSQSDVQAQQPSPPGAQANELCDRICGAIMLGASAAYLVLGFVWNFWHPGWVIFPVGGILCGIVSVLMKKEAE